MSDNKQKTIDNFMSEAEGINPSKAHKEETRENLHKIAKGIVFHNSHIIEEALVDLLVKLMEDKDKVTNLYSKSNRR